MEDLLEDNRALGAQTSTMICSLVTSHSDSVVVIASTFDDLSDLSHVHGLVILTLNLLTAILDCRS